MKEFENLVSLLESANSDNVMLGLQIARNYKKEFFDYFGCKLEVLEDLTDLLVQNNIWNAKGSIFEIELLGLSKIILSKIPKSVFILKKIKALCFLACGLHEIPKEIGELKHLQIFFIPCNRLQSIPKEIGKLKNLKSLFLSNNQLQTLPAEIGNLINLGELYLNNNQFQSLPKGIDKLSNLRKLNIRNNKIPTKEIAHLQRILPNCKIIT